MRVAIALGRSGIEPAHDVFQRPITLEQRKVVHMSRCVEVHRGPGMKFVMQFESQVVHGAIIARK
ncbi:hypothetical protein D3C87_2173180 [compost metagenome]